MSLNPHLPKISYHTKRKWLLYTSKHEQNQIRRLKGRYDLKIQMKLFCGNIYSFVQLAQSRQQLLNTGHEIFTNQNIISKLKYILLQYNLFYFLPFFKNFFKCYPYLPTPFAERKSWLRHCYQNKHIATLSWTVISNIFCEIKSCM